MSVFVTTHINWRDIVVSAFTIVLYLWLWCADIIRSIVQCQVQRAIFIKTSIRAEMTRALLMALDTRLLLCRYRLHALLNCLHTFVGASKRQRKKKVIVKKFLSVLRHSLQRYVQG